MASKGEGAFLALRWASLATIGKTMFQFLQVVVLARCLTPSDFGLLAIVLAVIAFVQTFGDFGLSSAVIHHADASDEELSSLYWMNLAVGTVLGAMMALAGPMIARIYNEPGLISLLLIAATSFAINSAGQQIRARAEQQLRFKRLAWVELISAVGGFMVASAVAFLHREPSALVWGLLATSLLLTSLSWMLLSGGWRPLFVFNWSKIRRFIHFGGFATLSSLINTVQMQADVVIGGRVLSANDLGAYSLARDLSLRLASVVNPIITRVSFPLMATNYADKTFVGGVYARAISAVAAVNLPLYLGLAVFSGDVLNVVFGEQWVQSAALLRVLALWGLARSLMNPVGSLLYACGRARAAFRWNASIIFLTVPACYIGSKFGALGLAAAQMAAMFLLFVPCWRYLVRPDTGLDARQYFGLMRLPLMISALSVLAAYAASTAGTSPFERLLIAAVVGAFTYLILSVKFNREWLDSLRRVVRG